jgi:hypothetical protein
LAKLESADILIFMKTMAKCIKELGCESYIPTHKPDLTADRKVKKKIQWAKGKANWLLE